jgi:hypothetical protein
VLGVDSEDEVGYWTRTTDGWYLSDKRSNVGHRDVRGPGLWTYMPTPIKAEWWDETEETVKT